LHQSDSLLINIFHVLQGNTPAPRTAWTYDEMWLFSLISIWVEMLIGRHAKFEVET